MSDLPPPFNQLPDSAVNVRLFNEPSCLFRQGDKPKCFYFLEQGEVVLIRHSVAGDEVVIHIAHGGETFAEAALFSDEYHCDALIQLPSRLWEINKDAVLTLSRQDAEFLLALTARFARQVQGLRRHKELLAIRSATERVYVALSEGMLQGSVKQLAASIGLTHEVVYRVLSALVVVGRVVKLGRGKYVIPEKSS